MRTELEDFVHHCRVERRLSPLTCSAYERDVGARAWRFSRPRGSQTGATSGRRTCAASWWPRPSTARRSRVRRARQFKNCSATSTSTRRSATRASQRTNSAARRSACRGRGLPTIPLWLAEGDRALLRPAARVARPRTEATVRPGVDQNPVCRVGGREFDSCRSRTQRPRRPPTVQLHQRRVGWPADGA